MRVELCIRTAKLSICFLDCEPLPPISFPISFGSLAGPSGLAFLYTTFALGGLGGAAPQGCFTLWEVLNLDRWLAGLKGTLNLTVTDNVVQDYGRACARLHAVSLRVAASSLLD